MLVRVLADLIVLVHVYAEVIGGIGGSVALLLGALKLREVVQRPRLDVRWNWSWDADRLSSVGFYFLNETSKPAHVEHFAFRHLLNETSKPPGHGAARFRLAGRTWHFVAPPASAKFPFTVAPNSVSEMITFEIGEADDPLRHVFARHTKALLLVDYNGARKEFDVPAEIALMPQEEVRYEL